MNANDKKAAPPPPPAEPPAPAGALTRDPELAAMERCRQVLDALPRDVAVRVLDWFVRRYESRAHTPVTPPVPESER